MYDLGPHGCYIFIYLFKYKNSLGGWFLKKFLKGLYYYGPHPYNEWM
jgi:hypothetical protein